MGLAVIGCLARGVAANGTLNYRLLVKSQLLAGLALDLRWTRVGHKRATMEH